MLIDWPPRSLGMIGHPRHLSVLGEVDLIAVVLALVLIEVEGQLLVVREFGLAAAVKSGEAAPHVDLSHLIVFLVCFVN